MPDTSVGTRRNTLERFTVSEMGSGGFGSRENQTVLGMPHVRAMGPDGSILLVIEKDGRRAARSLLTGFGERGELEMGALRKAKSSLWCPKR